MRKFPALILLTILAISPADARTLTPSQALTRAGISATSRSVEEPAMTVKKNNTPSRYVFNKPQGGFVVLSANDVAAPVIGYSETGTFDSESTPENFKDWLRMCADQICDASEAGVPAYSATLASAASNHPAIEPLMTTKWNQNNPYNLECPKDNGFYTYTGCVATAMAQVMKYHNWPDKAANNATFTNSSTGTTSTAVFDNFEFDWDNMLDTYNYGSYNETQSSAVAKLMQACGYSINMIYTTLASGAYSEMVGYALATYFKYDCALHNEPRELYTASAWDNIVYDNLRDYGPIVYWGSSSDGTHCFVCDGYDGQGYYHFNWGWGGMSDGYFLLNALDPESQGIGGSLSGYNNAQGALLGVKPATETVSSKHYTFYAPKGLSEPSVNGNYLYVNGLFKNYSPFSVNGSFKLQIYNEDGTEIFDSVKAILPSTAKDFGIKSSSSYVMAYLNSSLPDGTYRVYPAIEVDGIDYPFISSPGYPEYVIYSRSGYKNTASLPDTGKQFIDSLSSNGYFFEGKPYKISGIAKTSGESEMSIYVIPVLLSEDGVSVRATGTGFTLKFTPEGTPFEIISPEWFNDRGAKIPAGEWKYGIAIIDHTGNISVLSSGIVTIRDDAPTRGSYQLIALEVENAEAVDPESIKITAHVRGTGGVVWEDIYFDIFQGMSTRAYEKTEGFFVSADQDAYITHIATLPNAQPGQTYNVYCLRNIGGKMTYLNESPVKIKIAEGTESGLDNLKSSRSISVTSDPATDRIVINAGCDIVDINLISVSGLIMPAVIKIEGQTAHIESSMLTPGLYIAKVVTTNSVTTVKIIKK